MTTTRDLRDELHVFEQERGRLVAEGKSGKFAVVGEGGLAGVWDTYEDALQAGFSRFGLDRPFLVKKIEGIEGVQFFTKDITGCQA